MSSADMISQLMISTFAACSLVAGAQPFRLNQVRLLEGPFRDAMIRNEGYLLSLDPDRLLHVFRMNAGLPFTTGHLGGWEKPESEVRGHCTGHYLSACAMSYASRGNDTLKSRANYIVSEL